MIGSRLGVAAFLLTTLGGSLALSQQPSQPDPSTPRRPVVPPPSVSALPGAPEEDTPDFREDFESTEPADGKWLKADDGREYFVARLPKVRGTYRRIDEHTILYKYFVRLEITGEDKEWFHVKYYRALENWDEIKADLVRAEEEKLEGVAERYQFEARSVDRLEFAAFDEGLPRAGQWRQGFDMVDINGDGHLDIVHGPARKGIVTPAVFLGDGAGRWRFWSEAKWPELPFDYGDAAAADVNGDGLVDVGLGVHLRGLLVLIQEQPGRFVSASEGLPFNTPGRGGDATGFASRAVKLVDWNADGRPDLLALGEGPRQLREGNKGMPVTSSFGLVVFQNQEDGTWRQLSEGLKSGPFGDSFTLGDWNLDGRVDAAAVSLSLDVDDIVFYNADTPEGWSQAAVPTLRPGAWTFGITSGDFTGDGRADLVTSFANNDGGTARRGIELSSVGPDGAWKTELIFAFEGDDNIWSLASGDLDADGHLDLAASTEQGNLLVFLGDGAGGLAREEGAEMAPPAGCRGYDLHVVDVNGDGRSEILAAFAGETGAVEKLLQRPECHGGGALRAWQARPRTGAAS
jgi:hypothetical protein